MGERGVLRQRASRLKIRIPAKQTVGWAWQAPGRTQWGRLLTRTGGSPSSEDYLRNPVTRSGEQGGSKTLPVLGSWALSWGGWAFTRQRVWGENGGKSPQTQLTKRAARADFDVLRSLPCLVRLKFANGQNLWRPKRGFISLLPMITEQDLVYLSGPWVMFKPISSYLHFGSNFIGVVT